MAKPFIHKRKTSAEPIFSDIDIAGIYHPEINVPVGKPINVGGFGMQEVKGSGRYDKNRISIRVHGYGTDFSMLATRDDVHGKLRRIRPEEAQYLDALDNEIAAAEALIRSLKRRRGYLLQDAWKKAHVVTVKELIERIKPRA